MEMHDARLDRVVSLEAVVREYLEHLAVLAEDVGLELCHSIRVGDKTEMLEENRCDAMPLELVEHRERDLGTIWTVAANVPPDADETLASVLSHRRRQPDVIVEVELSQTREIVRRQVALQPHESKIDRLLAESAKMLVQPFLIVRPNRPDTDAGAVEHRRVDAIFSRLAYHNDGRVYRDCALKLPHTFL